MIKEETSLPPNLALNHSADVWFQIWLSVKLGVNMPAIAVCRQPRASAPNQSDTEVYDVIIYVGIIDILQNYGLQKRLEHVHKSLKYDLESISAVNPHFYADRLQEFIHRFFSDCKVYSFKQEQ
ncbi:hypothetical protein L7F22_053235 [Adiantum nelumboides]|nr:hypothetical protein [Adiantum nelumboides]